MRTRLKMLLKALPRHYCVGSQTGISGMEEEEEEEDGDDGGFYPD